MMLAWAPAFLLMAHLLALFFGRAHPFASLLAMSLLLSLLGLIWQKRERVLDANAVGVLFFLVLSVLTVGVVGLVRGHGSGWWKVLERLSLLSIVASVALSSCDPLRILLICFRVVLGCVVFSVVVGWWRGHSLGPGDPYLSLGAGNVSWLSDQLSIICFSWGAIIAVRWKGGGGQSLHEVASCAFLVFVTGLYSVVMERRAPLAMAVVVLVATVMYWQWEKRRRVIVAVAVLLLVVAVFAVVLNFASHAGGSERDERAHYVRTAIEVIKASFPWGFGGYGASFHGQIDLEWSRHFTATGTRIFSFHNEWLDLIADGGVAAGLFVLCACLLVLVRWRRIQNRGMSFVYFIAGLCIFVVSNLSNVFSHSAGSVLPCIVLGTFLGAPSFVSNPLPLSVLRCCGGAVRVLGSFVGMAGFVLLLPAVFVSREDHPLVFLDAARSAGSPYVFSSLVEDVEIAAVKEGVPFVADEAVDLYRNRLGVSLVGERIVASNAMARGNSSDEWISRLRVVEINPLSVFDWIRLYELRNSESGRWMDLPAPVRMRARFFGGDASLSPVSFCMDVHDLSTASDRLACAIWFICSVGNWERARDYLSPVVERYGDVPEVASVVVGMVVNVPDLRTRQLILGNLPRIHNGLRFADPSRFMSIVGDRLRASRCIDLLTLLLGDDSRYCPRARVQLDRIKSISAIM